MVKHSKILVFFTCILGYIVFISAISRYLHENTECLTSFLLIILIVCTTDSLVPKSLINLRTNLKQRIFGLNSIFRLSPYSDLLIATLFVICIGDVISVVGNTHIYYNFIFTLILLVIFIYIYLLCNSIYGLSLLAISVYLVLLTNGFFFLKYLIWFVLLTILIF